MDKAVLDFFQSVVEPGVLSIVMTFFTILGEAGLIWVAFLVCFAIKPRTRKIALAMLLAMLFMLLLNNFAIKYLVERPRPYMTYPEITVLIHKLNSYSFPSGHAAASLAAVSVLFWYKRKVGLLMLPVGVLIGFSRVYFSMHYLSDVLGGFAIGILCGALAIALADQLWRKYGGWMMGIGSIRK